MPATLTRRQQSHRVLTHLMEQQQAIELGERLRDLRTNSEETNGSIADYCNVRERTVAGWIAGDGISYKNAKRVAQLFEVDIDWLWRGRERASETPDVIGALSAPASASEVGRLESELAELRGEFSEMRSDLQLVLSLLQRGGHGQGEAADS